MTIIAGAGSGIGRAMAERFAQEGAKLVLADFSGAEEGVAKALDAEAMHTDLSDLAAIDRLVETTVARHGRLDIVCNNAGRGGAIVNTSSIAAFLATPGSGAYIGSKGGMLAMTRSAELEYADRNIRVNALCPGTIDTPLVQRVSTELRAELLSGSR